MATVGLPTIAGASLPPPPTFSQLRDATKRSAPSFTSSFTHSGACGSNASVFFQGAMSISARKPTLVSQRRQSFKVNALFGLGVPELVVIAGVAALIFGPSKLPEIGKSLGKTVKSFQQAADEFKTELKGDEESTPLPTPETPPRSEKENADNL